MRVHGSVLSSSLSLDDKSQPPTPSKSRSGLLAGTGKDIADAEPRRPVGGLDAMLVELSRRDRLVRGGLEGGVLLLRLEEAIESTDFVRGRSEMGGSWRRMDRYCGMR